MSEQQQQGMKPGEYEKTGSGGYENPMEEDITSIDSEVRTTSSGDESGAKTSATPESAGEDTVAGSPNQGTESR